MDKGAGTGLAGPRAALTSSGDLLDGEAEAAAGGADVDLFPDAATKQRVANRRLVRDPPVPWVGLRRADDQVLLGLAVLVFHDDVRAEAHAVGRRMLGDNV